MPTDIQDIQQHLEVDTENIPLESTLDPEDSPLNEPVAEGQVGLSNGASQNSEEANGDASADPNPFFSFDMPSPDDTPEQNIGQGAAASDSPAPDDPKPAFEMPQEMAELTADSYLGMADFALEIGSSFFVTIKKHKDFYEFEELIEIIDEHNETSVKQFKLDDDDKALLRPLLIHVIKRSTKQLSPESQFMAAVATVLVKKVKQGIEQRAKNAILLERCLDAIRGEKAADSSDSEQSAAAEANQADREPAQSDPEPETPEEVEVEEVE